MSAKHFIQIFLVGVAYLFFNNEFFLFTSELKQGKLTRFMRILNFFIVYAWFLAASVLELPLVVNWTVFLVMLGVQIRSEFSIKLSESYALSLFCVIMGLAVNIFFRSFMAIASGRPLNEFDNSLSDWKAFPIALGFLVVAISFRALRYRRFYAKLNLMIHDRKSFKFYFVTEWLIFLFLCVQLLTYSQTSNEMGIKMWGIKSALFSGVVLAVTINYSLRVASLHYIKQKQYENRDRLIQEKKDVDRLWALAYTDMLTGCNNRHLLDKRLEEYARYGGDITLAFVDLNGLKKVNDQYGHIEGDIYLKKVANTLMKAIIGNSIDLFRYGGDEFVLMSNVVKEQEMNDILIKINGTLKTEGQKYPYSISYGVVHGNAAEYKGLVERADEMMYDHKVRYYKREARI